MQVKLFGMHYLTYPIMKAHCRRCQQAHRVLMTQQSLTSLMPSGSAPQNCCSPAGMSATVPRKALTVGIFRASTRASSVAKSMGLVTCHRMTHGTRRYLSLAPLHLSQQNATGAYNTIMRRQGF